MPPATDIETTSAVVLAAPNVAGSMGKAALMPVNAELAEWV
jgi:hypothetical protein